MPSLAYPNRVTPTPSTALPPAPRFTRQDILLLTFAWTYMLPFIFPALTSYFSGDDFMNLYYHRFGNPPWVAFSDSLLFWTTYRRPVGGVVYLMLYSLFGLATPSAYYLTGFLLFTLNVALVFFLFIRLTGNPYLSALGTAVASLHREFGDIWFNFGAVYELLACGLVIGAFHAYWTATDAPDGARRTRWSLAAAALYILAIGGKEMAVTLPAILLAFELIYRTRAHEWRRRLPTIARMLLPFVVVAVVAAVGKTLGPDSMAEENPAYRYHVDSTIVQNLAAYLRKIAFNAVDFDVGWTLVTLAGALGLAVLLRNRHMVFGWSVFLITLLPVLGLPRNWGLFLYIPFIGVGLYVAAFLSSLGATARHLAFGARPYGAGATGAAWLGVCVVLALLTWVHMATFIATRQDVWIVPGMERRVQFETLLAHLSDVREHSVIALRDSPIGSYDLHFAIWLRSRKPGITVISGPNYDPARLQDGIAEGRTAYAFEYRAGVWVPIDITEVR